MPVNKVVMNTENGAETLIDLTNDTVTPDTLAEGATAHDAGGNVIIGTMPTETVLYRVQTLTDAQKTQARSNIGAVGKDNITLRVHSDGLMYVFVDGVPVGNGIALASGGDVVGNLDSDNNILLSGNLASGTYTLKYENADGTYTEIGTLEVGAVEPDTPVEPEVVNLFNPDTAIYNSRLGASGDLKAAGSCAGAVVTDFIDITNINKIKISGTYVANTSYSTLKYGKLSVYDANGTWLQTGINFDGTPDGLVYTASETKENYPTATQIRICLSIKANETITSADVTGVVIAVVE